MTQRDKKLLTYLGLFVVIVCFGYWGVRPLVKGINETNEAIIEAEEEKTINSMKTAQLPIYEKENEQLEKDIIEARKNFYPMMNADEVDKMFTGMALDYNLYAYDLLIEMPDEEVVSLPYQYSVKNTEESSYEKEEAGIESTDVESIEKYANGEYEQEEEEYETSTGIYVATVSMKLGGNSEDIVRLIDDLSANNVNMLVRSYQWENSSKIVSNEVGDYEFVEGMYLNIKIDLYMYKE